MASKDEEVDIQLIKKLPQVKHFLSTGCTLMDLAIADQLPGGLPAGRINQIYGGESSAKSVIMAEALGSSQRQGGRASLVDREGTWDEERSFNLHDLRSDDPAIWWLGTTNSIESLFQENIENEVKEAKEFKGPSCMGIDSLSGLPSETELEEDMNKSSYGASRAKGLSKGFRKYLGQIADSNLGMIFIDQIRDNVGVTFGEQTTTSGGWALKFYSSVRIKLTHEARIKNSSDKVIGIQVGFFIKKNKIAAPFREGSFRLLFDYGIDDVGSSIDWLHKNDPNLWEDCKKVWPTTYTGAVKKNLPWAIPALNVKGRGLNSVCEKVEEGDMEQELIKEVERVWRIVYASLVRKKRVRINN